MKVLCFGSMNIDYTYSVPHIVSKGETLSSSNLQVYTGGKGLNQAVALKRAGADTYMAGAVGEDGLFLRKFLEEAGINTHLVQILDTVRTGNAIIQNSADGDNSIILFGGANRAMTKEYIDSVFDEFEAGDIVVLQNEINGIEYIINCAYARNMKIVLNPAPMEDNIKSINRQYIDYLIVNETELDGMLDMFGTDFAHKSAADEDDEEIRKRLEAIHDIFCNAFIVLTVGERGSVAYDGEVFIKTDAYSVEPEDTTGAGDTFTGYLIAGIINGENPAKALKRASAAAAVAVTRTGAAPSIPDYEETLRFMEQFGGE